jgi:MFS transporter, ACS family, tartrate transporter
VIKQSTDSFSWALISVAAVLTPAAILIRVVGVSLQRQAGAAEGRPCPVATLSKGI